MDLPTGTITLVFTDIQDSSDFSEQYRAQFEPLRATHFKLLRDEMARWNGHEVSTAGDALFLVFPNAPDAVQFAVAAQRALANHDWPELTSAQSMNAQPTRVEIRVRIGMHTGEPFLSQDSGRADYFGPVVNRAARVSSAAYGGQILVSAATYALAQNELPDEITFRDCGLHRLKGVGEDQLWQVEAPELVADFPALKTLDAHKHNLPIPPMPYLGREDELAAWLARLRDPSVRVLTLTGFGGMGKTRSALHLAELSLDEYPDGVWWVEAEEARTGEELIQRIANALRMPLHPAIQVREQVHKFFRELSTLLILDNLEQVADAGRVVKDLMLQAPKVKFLITSRRPLELQAERVVELSPLSKFESAQLFVNRIRDRQPSFELTPENVADVDELCRRLDGVPLALELAASRIAMMAPRQMLQRLNERFKLLQTRAPDLPERQRALRAAIDWSYDLLSDDDKSLFAQISVFAGGFTLEDAEAVCEAFDVLEGIAELRRHSLLRSDTDIESQEARFQVLNSLREYALEKLNAGPDGSAARLRHARYFLQFAENRLSKLRTGEEVTAVRDLDANADNLRVAMEYALEAQEIELYARLGLSLSTARDRRGYSAEAQVYIQRAVEALRPLGSRYPTLLAELLAELTWVSIELKASGVENMGEEALRLFAEADDVVGQGRTEQLLGYAAEKANDYAKARAYFDSALARFSSVNSVVNEANVYNMLGIMGCTDPDWNIEEAARFLDEALRRRRRQCDVRGLAETLNNLGILAYTRREWSNAWDCYSEALTHEQDLHNWYGVARSLYNLAETAQAREDIERALRLAAASERLMDQVKSPIVRMAADLLDSIASRDEARAGAVRHTARVLSRDTLIAWALDDPER